MHTLDCDYQLTADSGIGVNYGVCKSRGAGVDPQLNSIFTAAGQSWSANLRGHYEFGARSRLQGDHKFATIAIPIGSAPGNATVAN